MALAADLADRVLLLRRGRARCAEGPPREVLTPENLRRAFGVEARIETNGSGRRERPGPPVTPVLGQGAGPPWDAGNGRLLTSGPLLRFPRLPHVVQERPRRPKEPREQRTSKVPEGLWVKCENCRQILYNKELARNFKICPKCGYHFRLSAPERLRMLFDDEDYVELDEDLRSADPLQFRDSKKYRDRLKQAEESVGTSDAIVDRARARSAASRSSSARWSSSSWRAPWARSWGRRSTRAAERALAERRPLILVSTSGGARMQEGILSLMQMGKISAALARLAEAQIPYISVMTDPTTGGVTASYAMLGDLNIAEPNALIGFAGPARHRADDPADAAGGISALRVPARARDARLHRRALRDEGDARAVPASGSSVCGLERRTTSRRPAFTSLAAPRSPRRSAA